MPNHRLKKSLVKIAITATLGLSGTTLSTGASAFHTEVSFAWNGLLTLLDPGGSPLQNTSYPYYGDPTWGYGYRTQISGDLTFDTTTGYGTATIAPFQFFSRGNQPGTFSDITLTQLGDGSGGPGPLIQADMLFGWNNNNNIPVSLIWDASGMLGAGPYSLGQTITGVGALPASNSGSRALDRYPIGPAPLATTTLDSAFPLTGDGIGGIPMSEGPFPGFNMNIDITSMTVTAVPLPPALWLFGTGLIGMVAATRRSRGSS